MKTFAHITAVILIVLGMFTTFGALAAGVAGGIRALIHLATGFAPSSVQQNSTVGECRPWSSVRMHATPRSIIRS